MLNFYAVLAQKKVAVDSLSTHHLQEVTIKEIVPSDPFTTTRKVEVDSLWIKTMPQLSLSELLGRQSAVYLKEYGVGGLATPVIRGASGGQTAVLWNGINIQSPMSASIDFSLIPVSATDKITVQYGGSSAQQGTSVMGGAILLDNSPRFSSGISSTGRFFVGSFGRWGQQYEASLGSLKIYASTKFFQQEAQNNYPYKNVTEPNQPIVYQINNQSKQKGFIQEFSWKIDSTQSLNTRIWYQENSRNLPPTMGVTFSRQQQQDYALRTMIDWIKRYKKFNFIAKGAYLSHDLGYQDPDTKVNSTNAAQTFVVNLSSQFVSKNQLIGVGVEGTFNRSNTSNYGGISPKQDRIAGYLNYSVNSNNQRFGGVLNLRQEFYNGKVVPIMFSTKGTYKITKAFSLNLSASRNYRLPSLNDLYWSPGGNLNLVPEDAWMQDIALEYLTCNPKWWSKIELAAFNSVINQAIVWLPGKSGIWSPINVNQTWGRGLEFSYKVGLEIGKVNFTTQIQYNFTKNTINSSKNDDELGKQLIYTPIHRGLGGVTTSWKGILVNYTQTFTGLRYSTSDNSDWTEGYTLGSALISYQLNIKHFNGNVFAQVNNLWNVDYQILPLYASPGVNYQMGISISAMSLFNQSINPIYK